MKKDTFGLNENVASALSYITCLAGIIFFLSEKENKVVRFNAFQSILLWGIYIVVGIVRVILSSIPTLGFIFTLIYSLLGFLVFILSIYLFVKTYKGVKVELPFISDIADKKA
jgi:uncharacterized membrane protein